MNNSTNETVAECVIDCVSESSSLLDEIEIILVGLVALVGIAAWGYRKYKAMMADGSISLSEIVDSMEDIKEKVKEAEDIVEDVTEAAESVKAKAVKKERKCSNCGMPGHTKKTCPVKDDE